MELFKETGRVKLEAVKEYINSALEVGEKFVVFGHHQEVLDGIESVLRTKKVAFIRWVKLIGDRCVDFIELMDIPTQIRDNLSFKNSKRILCVWSLF